MNDKLTTEINEFPETFGLRAFPGETFKINPADCYVNDYGQPEGPQVVLYTAVLRDGKWLAHSKGSPAELRRNMALSIPALEETVEETEEVATEQLLDRSSDDSSFDEWLADVDTYPLPSLNLQEAEAEYNDGRTVSEFIEAWEYRYQAEMNPKRRAIEAEATMNDTKKLETLITRSTLASSLLQNILLDAIGPDQNDRNKLEALQSRQRIESAADALERLTLDDLRHIAERSDFTAKALALAAKLAITYRDEEVTA